MSKSNPLTTAIATALLLLCALPGHAQTANDNARRRQAANDNARQQQQLQLQRQISAQRLQLLRQQQAARLQQIQQQRLLLLQQRQAQLQQQQRALQQRMQNAQREQQAKRLGATAGGNQPADRLVFTNGVAKLNTPPTVGEMRRGFPSVPI